MNNQTRILLAVILALPVLVAAAMLASNSHETGDPAGRTISSPESGVVSESAEIAWGTDYQSALAEAESTGKPVLVDFYATWCGPCKLMDKNTFTNAEVRSRVTDFIPLKIDVDRHQELAAKYGIRSIPTTAVLRPDGSVVTGAMGYLKPAQFLELLAEATEPAPVR